MKKLLMILPVAFLTSCCTGDMSAERATFEVIEPAHRGYVEADENLTEEQKLRRLRLLDAWKLRLDAGKGESK